MRNTAIANSKIKLFAWILTLRLMIKQKAIRMNFFGLSFKNIFLRYVFAIRYWKSTDQWWYIVAFYPLKQRNWLRNKECLHDQYMCVILNNRIFANMKRKPNNYLAITYSHILDKLGVYNSITFIFSFTQKKSIIGLQVHNNEQHNYANEEVKYIIGKKRNFFLP